MMEKIMFDKQMEFAIKFKSKEDEDIFWVDFEGVEVIGGPEELIADKDTVYEFYNFDMGNGLDPDNEATFEDAYKQCKMLDGFIKWDGCMEIHNFNHHWCGKNNFVQRIVDMIYEQAKEIIGDRFENF